MAYTKRTPSNTESQKAPVPKVDKQHFRDMANLERNPKHLHDKLHDEMHGK